MPYEYIIKYSVVNPSTHYNIVYTVTANIRLTLRYPDWENKDLYAELEHTVKPACVWSLLSQNNSVL